MRRRVLLAAILASAGPAFAQPAPLLDSLTQADAGRGIREALGLAARNATSQLSMVNGFYGNPNLRIPLPGVLGDAQQRLRPFGLSKPLDDLEISLNRAAEATMPEAANMFVDAVQSVTLSDAISIVRGGDDSATRYLRSRTETRLTRLIRPPMTSALTQSGAFTLLNAAAREVGMARSARGLRTEVIDFSVTKALDGAFTVIAQEERAIRRDPWRRTSDILRRVFGPA